MNLPRSLAAALLAIILPDTATAAEVAATFASATTIPITAAGYTATGNRVNLALNFAPPAGTNLTVVKNTALPFIVGSFSNLAQGQKVSLTYDGITYPFVANYFGGSGNDLVLQWANTRLLGWGTNGSTQLGNLSAADRALPGPVLTNGVLAGKTVVACATGYYHTLALCSDGTLASWGSNSDGELGNNSTTSSYVPTLVDRSGVLAGKTVIAISCGASFSVALCSDGSVATWGQNTYGNLGSGDATNVNRSVPVLVRRSGVLSGKTVVAIAAGGYHCLALCSDGIVAAWGSNHYGPLGDNTSSQSSVPVLVNRSGVLAGKTVTAIAAGFNFSLGLCSDGSLAAWGSNDWGQLGNSAANYGVVVPVLVSKTGGLAGKTPVAIACGATHGLALCSDGNLAAWGYNNGGQLGNGTTTNSSSAVAVSRTGALAGKTVAAIGAGGNHCWASCSDGTMAGWGDNRAGELGNDSTTASATPVAVSTSTLAAGERIMAAYSGHSSTFDLALIGSPPAAVATTLAATEITDSAATLNCSINANGSSTTVTFEYGPTTAYGSSIAATPSPVTGTAVTAHSATPSGLLGNTTYHFRVVASSAGGTVRGADLTFTTTQNASLAGLTLSEGTLSPAFAASTTAYSAIVPPSTAHLTINPVAMFPTSTLTVNGSASAPLDLAVGSNSFEIMAMAADGINSRTYTISVTRLPEIYAFDSAATVPVTARDAILPDVPLTLALNFAPAPGTALTVFANLGSAAIQGRFSNLAQGQPVTLTYDGVAYPFVANYYGGTGNDLVLLWANTAVVAWGTNTSGQLGINSTTNATTPAQVIRTGALNGRTVIATATGGGYSLALCADGTLAAWGANNSGQLGNNSTTGSNVPVLVDRSGVLAGKTVVAITAGFSHSLALCADGTIAAWGPNSLCGINTTTNCTVPVLVDRTGALAGKSVVAMAAGESHSLALCADGTLVAWGSNFNGQLGNNSTVSSSVPILVDRSGVLAGKQITAVAAGAAYSMVLFADGTFAAWGYNWDEQLGIGSTTTEIHVPMLGARTGILAGKSVAALVAGGSHCLALCSDGTLAGWGSNTWGQLGNGSTAYTGTLVPVGVTRTGVLLGKSVTAIFAGSSHSIALCADGTLAAWGDNSTGELGNGGTTSSPVPVLTGVTGLTGAQTGCKAFHSLAIQSLPPTPIVSTLAATGAHDTGAILQGRVSANGSSTIVSFEYGLTTAYGNTVAATPETLTGSSATAVSAEVSGLDFGKTYHYRVVATSPGGTTVGEDLTFTTTNFAGLTELTLSRGTLLPAFDILTTSYIATVPAAVDNITVAPVSEDPDASVTVNGSTSGQVALAPGDNTILVAIAAANGVDNRTYTVRVTRLPDSFTFNSATSVPVTVDGFIASGIAAPFALTYPPVPGTNLTVVDNTSRALISGGFDNLAQNQTVRLGYNGITYTFVANYFGGTGNDLVLHWADIRLLSWGANSSGQLGNGGTTSGLLPAPVLMSGVLAGKTVTSVATGDKHSLALCSDGTLAAWGNNSSGQLGNGATNYNGEMAPVLVNRTGVLAGRTVIAIAAGTAVSLALCADGTVAAWGSNSNYQLGDSTPTQSSVPVMVNRTGVLANRPVVAIAAGYSHCLALCADGNVAGWGANNVGQLGINSTTSSAVPVLVSRAGVLATRQVVAISAGTSFSVARCADGSVATWGANDSGTLGNNTTNRATSPVLVYQFDALSGKSVMAATAGGGHCLALCSDGTFVSWGSNANGQLGTGNTTKAGAPILVSRAGILAGKTVVGIAAGASDSLALCADGTLAAWGINSSGQLGNNSTTQSLVPVVADASALKPGEQVTQTVSGSMSSHGVLLVASPPTPIASTLTATSIRDMTAFLNADIQPNGTSTSVVFEYGPTPAYGTVAAANPPTVGDTGTTSVSCHLGGLLPGTIYHFRVLGSYAGGTTTGADMTFTTTQQGTLSGLNLSEGTLQPVFPSNTTHYSVTVPNGTSAIAMTPVAFAADSTIKVNGSAVPTGTLSEPINLAVGNTVIAVTVTGADGIDSQTYTVTVSRLPGVFTFNSAAEAPLAAGSFSLSGSFATFALNGPLVPGTNLTVLNNMGSSPVLGTFDNLPQGSIVPLTFGNTTYHLIANYRGGTGNDLVLEWATRRVIGWGDNGNGQLGNGATFNSNVPVAADGSGLLAGRTVLDLTASSNTFFGSGHSLALCADGTFLAWGDNYYSQLGISGTQDVSVPTAVIMSGALTGKTIAALSAGAMHNLLLCTDGSLVAWAKNDDGQLGIGTTTGSTLPVAVDHSGVLAGKSVAAIAAGYSHNLALCTDGSLVSWGWNTSGQLGDNSLTNRTVPVLVDRAGILFGKAVVSIAAGFAHSLALCADGSLAAWGANGSGRLGNNSTTQSSVPVWVDRSGVLAGKTIIAIAVGGSHSLALCTDGTVVAWGANTRGQLGNNTTTASPVPVLVERTGVLAGKLVVGISAGDAHSLAWCADGTLVAWGSNATSQLGNNSNSDSKVPVAVDANGLRKGERLIKGECGPTSRYSLALTGLPLQGVTATPATAILSASASLNAIVDANGNVSAVSFEYGLDSNYGNSVVVSPAVPAVGTGASVNAPVTGLIPETTYHFRAVVASHGGIVRSNDLTFTTGTPPTFAGYTVSTPFQTVTTVSLRKLLTNATAPNGDALSVTAAGPVSASGGTAALQATGILYTPPTGFAGTDTFLVTITDAGGAAVTGTVAVAVGPAPSGGGQTANQPLLTHLPDGKISLKFQGIPGRNYQIQRSLDLTHWTTLGTVTATASGALTFTDDSPPEPNGYYRLAMP